MVWIMIGLFAGLLLIGVPIGFSLIIASVFGLWMLNIPLMQLIQGLYSGINSFPFLAVPFFIIAGSLMETGGISLRLVNLCRGMLGHVRGGLGMAVVVSEVLFSGISGSAVADASAIGSTMLPAMKRAGYSVEHSVSIVTASAGMGVLIPPCLSMIVLASIADLSVAALFLSGFLPGFFQAVALMALIYYQARKGILPGGEEAFSIRRLAKASRHAIIPMIMPVIIFGGIFSGAATATEVAVLAVVYALIVGLVIYREFKISDIPKMLVDMALIVGSVTMVVGGAMLFAWLLTVQHVPEILRGLILPLSSNPYIFLVIANLAFMLLGAVIEPLPALLILYPILFPVAKGLLIHPLHFALLAIASTAIGSVLPPIGILLIVTSSIGKTSLSSVSMPMLPYVAILFATLLVIMFNPWLVLLLPKLLYY